ncbi:hypothetical protein [Acidovorax sp. PRC11]|uniref:hypothetical protein n=1 Tax=Acidovorax sp. PRC11 TaxID=2962592 RepID=UPI0028818D08|nr:hypothetical protein [Acidovorax sp. PRC11]MDT0139208.1 hypothetical protein [Acidovorax sp. PRC11]
MPTVSAQPSSLDSRYAAPQRSGARPLLLAVGGAVIAVQVAAMAWVLEDHVRHAEQQQHAWVARGMQSSTAREPQALAASGEADWSAGSTFAAR